MRGSWVRSDTGTLERLKRNSDGIQKGRLSFSCEVYILVSIFLKRKKRERERRRKSIDFLPSIYNVSDTGKKKKGEKREKCQEKKRRTNTNTESEQ